MKYLDVELDKSSLLGKEDLLRGLETDDCTFCNALSLIEDRYGKAMICRPGNMENCIIVPVREGLLLLPFGFWEGIEMVHPYKARTMDTGEYRLITEGLNNEAATLTEGLQALAKEYGLDGEPQTAGKAPVKSKELTYMGHALDLDGLLRKDDLLERLRIGTGNYNDLSEILTCYEDIYENDLKWHYPVSDSVHSGGFLVPVREGLLYIPYDEVYSEGYEVLLPDKASLMDRESCEVFINELTSYVDSMCAAMREAMEVFKA